MRIRELSLRRFNPRARGGRDFRAGIVTPDLGRFNPRARGGRDRIDGIWYCVSEVSIHAPVGGATARRNKMTYDELVSIHAPVKGATG